VPAHEIIAVDPVLDPADEAAIRELCTHFGRYRTYGELEPIEIPEGPGLAQRHDSVMNFLRSGGLEAARERVGTLAARTSYFREEYAYAGELFTPAIAPFLHSERLAAAARVVHGRPVIEPQIAYANLMVPGQELAVHTDVPEFRGANRKLFPQWLMVVMHHSGLFERWRMPIATGSWSRILQFGQPRIEYICPYGHGTLREDDLQISGIGRSEWQPHSDNIWAELCATGEEAGERK